jgi:nucleoside-diphosphate-sugar epimerase
VLASQGLRIRVASSDFRNCFRIARFPVELVRADLSDHHALSNAVADCSTVFHCGYRFGGTPEDERRVNLEGTIALAEAFLKTGGRRFVHISSITVYGEPCDGEITEESPQRATREAYGNVKQEIERALRDLHRTRGLTVTILQPTIVYGPYGHFFTIRLLDELRSTRIALPAGGICNAVYVDDVVSAAILAATRDAAVGETFIVSGSSPTTWRRFYAAYERMLDKNAVSELEARQLRLQALRQRSSESPFQELRRGLAKRPELRQRLLKLPPHGWALAIGQRVLPNQIQAVIRRRYNGLWDIPFSESGPPLMMHDGFWGALYAAKPHARIDKARKYLGYDPTYDLDEGMARTAQWARWSNLLAT